MIFRRGNVPATPRPGEKLREFDRDLIKFLDAMATNLAAIFNKGVSFDDNTDTQIISYVSNATPDTEDVVAHTLKRVPEGFLVLSVDQAAIVYKSAAATTAAIKLKTNVAGVNVKLVLF